MAAKRRRRLSRQRRVRSRLSRGLPRMRIAFLSFYSFPRPWEEEGEPRNLESSVGRKVGGAGGAQPDQTRRCAKPSGASRTSFQAGATTSCSSHEPRSSATLFDRDGASDGLRTQCLREALHPDPGEHRAGPFDVKRPVIGHGRRVAFQHVPALAGDAVAAASTSPAVRNMRAHRGRPVWSRARGRYSPAWRLLRCNPFSHGGFDPVPDRFTLRGSGPIVRRSYHGED